MKSKELNEIFNKTRRTPNISLTPEQVKELVKDLEDLQTLKSFINIYLQFQLVYDDIDHYEIIPVKQYIGNSGCLLLTEDKMKKILDICND